MASATVSYYVFFFCRFAGTSHRIDGAGGYGFAEPDARYGIDEGVSCAGVEFAESDCYIDDSASVRLCFLCLLLYISSEENLQENVLPICCWSFVLNLLSLNKQLWVRLFVGLI